MNTPIRERELSKKALSYIAKCLSDGHTLSRLLLQAIRLDKGSVTTFLPESLGVDEAEDFQHGGKLPQPPPSEWRQWGHLVLKPIPSAIDDLVRTIREFLSRPGMEPICLLENELAERGDPGLARDTSKLVYFESEVYHVLTAEMAVEEQILQAIREAQSIPLFVGCLATLDPESRLDPRTAETVSLEDLSRIAQRVEKIFVRAYDGESYLIWSRGEG
jgi:hypothetical protein